MTNTNTITDTALVEDIIGTLARYGWNVDRKSLSAVLALILHQLRAHQNVADVMVRYLQDPELMAIDSAASASKEKTHA